MELRKKNDQNKNICMLTVVSKMHNDRNKLFFIETGK